MHLCQTSWCNLLKLYPVQALPTNDPPKGATDFYLETVFDNLYPDNKINAARQDFKAPEEEGGDEGCQ